jgi:hypothetical protein
MFSNASYSQAFFAHNEYTKNEKGCYHKSLKTEFCKYMKNFIFNDIKETR